MLPSATYTPGDATGAACTDVTTEEDRVAAFASCVKPPENAQGRRCEEMVVQSSDREQPPGAQYNCASCQLPSIPCRDIKRCLKMC